MNNKHIYVTFTKINGTMSRINGVNTLGHGDPGLYIETAIVANDITDLVIMSRTPVTLVLILVLNYDC